MITKKYLKLTPKKISGWLTMIVIVLTVAAFISVSIFLYRNFYQTITQTKEILVLKNMVALDTVNMQKFDLIIDRLTKKTTPKKLKATANPFY